ncbi:MAG: transcriptional regulator [bacterium]|nr:transcriptional regulator [bacterium]
MDDVLLSKVRLAIVMELLAADWVSFSELGRATEVTAGNLATHLARLVEAGYVKERKSFHGRRPLTTYHLTAAGKRALTSHADWLARMVAPIRPAASETA